jgi:hypothetical protein
MVIYHHHTIQMEFRAREVNLGQSVDREAAGEDEN